ncbi:MAG: hypothetical protein NC253_13580 [Ruminococcus sp.]|nr:hypothetical protein [Ruminococcus sp.]MCM1381475.1 hypothetical protein [Muribaculaceae bacterium]MCM1480094.1 hypothetical protein [Muribaculaceae bacterium]
MKVLYFVLFAAVGLFCVIAAVKDWKWFIDYWSYRNGMPRQRLKNRNVLRFLIGAAGVLLIAYGAAVLAGWL